MKLKLEMYILGMLTINPGTGYDVNKFLETEGRFERKKAPLSQIYSTLKRMTENELVTFRVERRNGKPDLKIYSITQKGRNFLINYLQSPLKSSFRYIESELLFRIRYAFLVDPEVIHKHIQDELDYRRKQISKFRHRDRTIVSILLSPEELRYVQAINDELHGYGARGMDIYVAYMEEMLLFFEKCKETAEAIVD